MLRAYSSVLLTPQVRPKLIAVFLSAAPLGMLSLTIVLSLHEWTGSLRTAGLVSGVFGLANALGLSIQGPLIDRLGARPVVMAAGSLCAASLIGFGAVGVLSGALWFIATLVAIAGVSVPAITAAVRSWLPTVLAAKAHRAASYALLSALFQGAVTVGPLLVSVALVLYGPALGVAVAALLVFAATVVFAFTSDHQAKKPTAESSFPPRSRVSPFPGLLTLLIAAVLMGLAVGVTGVAVPGILTSTGLAAIAGVAFGALALGEVLSAILFGSRSWPGRRSIQLPVTQAFVALTAVLIFWASQQAWLMVIAMFCAGVMRAPVSVLMSALLDEVVSQAALGRSYSLLVAVGLMSGAAGNALAGLLVDHTGVHGLLLIPVLSLSLASAWTAAHCRTLKA